MVRVALSWVAGLIVIALLLNGVAWVVWDGAHANWGRLAAGLVGISMMVAVHVRFDRKPQSSANEQA